MLYLVLSSRGISYYKSVQNILKCSYMEVNVHSCKVLQDYFFETVQISLATTYVQISLATTCVQISLATTCIPAPSGLSGWKCFNPDQTLPEEAPFIHQEIPYGLNANRHPHTHTPTHTESFPHALVGITHRHICVSTFEDSY